jgi:phosphoribulokinase
MSPGTRPVSLGIAGDSGAGKTTLTRGLVRILGEHQVTHVSADHYVRYDRRQRLQHDLTPLHPKCNHLDILEQHLHHLRAGEPILKPVYNHRDGSFQAAEYTTPNPFTIIEGLLAFHAPAIHDLYDVRVFLDPPEDLRRKWKVQRDSSRRGYTTDQILDELDRREHDAEAYIRPQRHHADLTIAFMPGDRGDPDHLDAEITMRPGLAHPDLSTLIDATTEPLSLTHHADTTTLSIPGTITPQLSHTLQDAFWSHMHFASHLRTERLGEFTIGTQLHRSDTLAITQLLVLYQLVVVADA